MSILASSKRWASDLGVVMAGTVACSFPVYLVGALGVQLRSSLHFGATVLGVVAALYYLGAGASAIPLGGAAEAVGALRTMRLAAAASACFMLLIAVAAHSWIVLALLVLPAGVASAAMQPATNIFLVRRVASDKQGLAFGVKQSAVPLTSALGGLAVPALALTVGWRWAFVAAGVWAALTALSVPRSQETFAARRERRRNEASEPLQRRPLVVLAAGFGIGVAAASSLTAFLVSSAVSGGISRANAGLLAALGGVIAATSRIVIGRLADRRGHSHLPVVVTMIGLGTVGYATLALASATRVDAVYLVAVVVAFGGGWGWNGLFNFAVITAHPRHPGQATGIIQAGGRFGGVLGPFAFGEIVSHSSYSVAWGVTAASTLCAAGVILIGRRLLRDSLRRLPEAAPAKPPLPSTDPWPA